MYVCVRGAGLCVDWSDSFAFWEVIASGLIAAVTIGASVWLARYISRREAREALKAERRHSARARRLEREEADRLEREAREQRRRRVIATFGDWAGDIIVGARDGSQDVITLVRSIQYMSRISVDTRNSEEAACKDWIEAATEGLLKTLYGTNKAVPVSGANIETAATELHARMEDLRGWAAWPGGWAEYLERQEEQRAAPSAAVAQV